MGSSVAISEAGDRARCNILIEGFRPLVYSLAEAHQLSGIAVNSQDGVPIEGEGNTEAIARFTTESRRRTYYSGHRPLRFCPRARQHCALQTSGNRLWSFFPRAGSLPGQSGSVPCIP